LKRPSKKILFGSFAVLVAVTLFFTLRSDGSIDPDLTVQIPMRDGTHLPTDIYLPYKGAKKKPIVLVRTPSGKRAYYQSFLPLTESGYIVAIQDARSFLDKEGKSMPWITDGWGELQDGYDTIDWLSKSSYSNGKIGTIGFSAMGISQLLLAPTAHPSLKAQYIGFAVGDMYNQAIYMGGQVRKNQVEGWLGYYARHPGVLKAVLGEKEDSPFWKCVDCISQAHRVNTPALHYGGWYDTFSQGTLDSFVAFQNEGDHGAKGKQVLVMGPWTHHYPRDMRLGDYNVPENAHYPPHEVMPHHWFDHYLKGDHNNVKEAPPVIYYVMGPFDGTSGRGGVWKTAQEWPIPAKPYTLYLNTHGKLDNRVVSAGSEGFVYDPENPTPTVGGRNLFLAAGPKDQTPIEEREDVVVFTSDPLEEDLEVTGRLFANIYFTSDRSTTDVALRLTDVYPDGKSVLIADGIKKLQEGESNPVEVDLWSTSQVFAKGHRIRLSVSSANYPQFERNFNGGTEEEPRVATNRVLFGPSHPSRITLPVVMDQ